MLVLALVMMTSLPVTETKAVSARSKRDAGFYNWGLGILNNVKDTFDDYFGEEETASSSTTTPTTTTTYNPTTETTAPATVLNDAQCQAALTQCALRDVTKAEYRATWWKQEVMKKLVQREVRKVHLHYRVVLKQMRKVLIALFNAAIKDPSMTSLPSLCDLMELGEPGLDGMMGDEGREDDVDDEDYDDETSTHQRPASNSAPVNSITTSTDI